MDVAREIVIVGTSFHATPVELRELVAVTPQEVPQRIDQLKSEVPGLREAWMLSTCNRCEVAVVTDDPWIAEAAVKEQLFERLDPGHIYAHHGTDAVFHLFRVGAGLDSQVLGESQILGQIKDATERAHEGATVGETLRPLLDQALQVGKRVRTETRVGEGTLSIARAGVDLAHKVLGDLSDVRATIVGAGETGQLVARHLVDLGATELTFVNRTLARAEAAVERFGGRAMILDDLAEALVGADLTVVSVDTTRPLVRKEHFKKARVGRRDQPPIVIDLSIPRAVDAKVGKLDLLLHDLDDLRNIVDSHHDERQSEVRRAEGILVQEVHKFLGLRTYRAMKPVIMELEERFRELTEETLGRMAEDAPREVVADKLMRRLLAEARSQLKEGARASWSPEVIDRLYRSHRRKDP